MSINNEVISKNYTLEQSYKTQDSTTLWSDLDSFYCRLEKGTLNRLGYVPLVGTATGIARIGLGILQTTIGLIGAVIEPIIGTLSSKRSDSIRHYDAVGACWEHMIHGPLNAIRGIIEIVPLLPLITLAPYDLAGSFYHYRSEQANCKLLTQDRVAIISQGPTVVFD